ncbi:MAG: pullulanase-type alpha-1,6-glucosidase [Xanthomonadales bacterium]
MTNRFFARAMRATLGCGLGALVLLAPGAMAWAAAAADETDLGAARAYWLAADAVAWAAPEDAVVRLHHSAAAALRPAAAGLAGGDSLDLARDGVVAGRLAERFPHLAGLPLYRLDPDDLHRVPAILRGQFAVGATRDGELQAATALQPAGVLDDLFAYPGDLGPTFTDGVPSLRLWAPTARSVRLLLFDDADPASAPSRTLPMAYEPASGTWALTGEPDWAGTYYLYEVEVFVRRSGRIERNRVTDPYALGLSMDSRRSLIVDLADPRLAPTDWGGLEKPAIAAPEDIVLYELHVRDFSSHDPSVPADRRGTFAAFAESDTHGIRHLRRLAAAGLTHVHLLPAFDCATIPENPAERLAPPDLTGFAPDSMRQQAAIDRVRARDAFNWCYDPFHYTVPEGSYATDPDGVRRIVEFRAMVQALNRMGLRVVMDVVYNHTTSSGQAATSVLDRIVPDYYHRLDAAGDVETSTCCANTATEHAMMEKLMIDSLLTWARAYKVDGFRFDLMGHHGRASIEKARDALQALTPARDGVDGRAIYLYGEGWNFGEVADDARFVQATQRHMGDGSGVGTFNDRLRDAVRGGAHDDRGLDHVRGQGFVNGLYYDPNAENAGSPDERARLLHAADLVRAGLAGNLADYVLTDRHGRALRAADIDYHGQAAGYASDPQETVNYVAAHDNETLFDINQYKLPVDTSMDDRVRVVNLANSLVMLAQGVPFVHAGQELLRSKSLDRNSFDSGDWFNRLDLSYGENGWARGLPPAWDNEANWPVAGPLLADPALRPAPRHIRAALAHFEELLRIRASSNLFRLRTAADVAATLAFHNTGPDQVPGLIVMSLAGDDERLVVAFNATREARTVPAPLPGAFALHPVQRVSADPVVRTARWDPMARTLHVPPRTTVVFLAN